MKVKFLKCFIYTLLSELSLSLSTPTTIPTACYAVLHQERLRVHPHPLFKEVEPYLARFTGCSAVHRD